MVETLCEPPVTTELLQESVPEIIEEETFGSVTDVTVEKKMSAEVTETVTVKGKWLVHFQERSVY